MYIPESFKVENPERLAALIRDNSFGMLITAPEGVPFITHLPFLLEPSAGKHGKLLGHMARANPQWRHFAPDTEVLAVFQGPHAYISPSWYLAPNVPTWNYAVAHVRGIPRLIEDPAELDALVERLTQHHESEMPSPYQSEHADALRAKLLDMIVGFEIEITELQGKFKLSQNRSQEEQRSVIEGLNQADNPHAAAVAKLMSGT